MDELTNNKVLSAALYLDAENVNNKIDLSHLMHISLPKGANCGSLTFRRKLACGKTDALIKFKKQLDALDFTKIDTSHVVGKKNRADLKISVEAMESLLLERTGSRPPIDVYVFITSDSDFTVITKKLIEYGKIVIVVIRAVDAAREVFTNSCTKVLLQEDNFFTQTPPQPKKPSKKNNAKQTADDSPPSQQNAIKNDDTISTSMGVAIPKKTLFPQQDTKNAQSAGAGGIDIPVVPSLSFHETQNGERRTAEYIKPNGMKVIITMAHNDKQPQKKNKSDPPKKDAQQDDASPPCCNKDDDGKTNSASLDSPKIDTQKKCGFLQRCLSAL